MTKRRPIVAATNLPWSVSQKLEAVTTYHLLGTIAATARALSIPEVTVTSWKRTEWWQEQSKELASSENILLNNRLKKIVEKSLDIVGERLDNGDHIYDQKAGKIVRKPVVMKDAHRVAIDMANMQNKLKTTEQVSLAEENIHEKLDRLAKEFARVANKQQVVEVTDVVFATEQPASEET